MKKSFRLGGAAAARGFVALLYPFGTTPTRPNAGSRAMGPGGDGVDEARVIVYWLGDPK